MDFPHVDEKTQERFTRLWPKVSENALVKEAAKDAPDMIGAPTKAEKEAAGGFHYKLYENRIPSGLDADAAFGAFATDEARAGSQAEMSQKRAGERVMDASTAEKNERMYPQEARYYPAMAEGNREAFLQAVKDAGFTTKTVGDKKADVSYVRAEGVQAFVSSVGPIPELARWQTDEAKALWRAEGEKLKQARESNAEEMIQGAGERVVQAAGVAGGKGFLADNAKGLVMPAVKDVEPRKAVMESISQASDEDLSKVRQKTESEYGFLGRKQYAIQVEAFKGANPGKTDKDFNDLDFAARRTAAKGAGLSDADFTRRIGLQYGLKALDAEMNSRGMHLTRDQALDKQAKAGEEQKKKPVDEKSKSLKPASPEKPAAEKRPGRAGSRGGAAAAMLGTLGQGR